MRDDYRARVRPADEAAALVRDVDDVLLPLAPGQPVGFLRALGARDRFGRLADPDFRGELRRAVRRG